MNIFVGKLGKSILFNRDNWGPIGGDNEAPVYFENLFHRNPDIDFYMFGSNDFSRLSSSEQMRINKNGNVHNIWDQGWKTFTKNYDGPKVAGRLKYLEHWVEEAHAIGLKMDKGILFAGPVATSNVPGKTTKMKTPDEISTPIEMIGLYSGPLVDYLNVHKTPYMLIVNDPRYFPPQSKDWMHPPSQVLSQFDEEVTFKRRTTYRDNTLNNCQVKCDYARVETIFLINNKDQALPETESLDTFFGDPDPVVEGERDIKFMIVCNEGAPSRYKLLCTSILDDMDDVDVYGKWNEETIGDDKRFKGSKPYGELHAMLPRVKYTYCIPIKKGWVTAKFWEMAHHGIIPFLHPTYDEQDNLKAPDFLRVANSKELDKKIDFLERNPDAYETLIGKLKDMLKDEYYDGSYLNDLTLEYLNKI